MLKGEARPARIPFPTKKAGFKKPASYYHRGKKGLPEDLPTRLRNLKGKDRTLELRRVIRKEAFLKKQPLRWGLAFLAWGLLALISVNSLFDRTYGVALPFVFLVAAIAWAGAFSANPTTRLLAAFALLLAALLCMAGLQEFLGGGLLAVVAVGMIIGAIPQIRQEMEILAQVEREREAARKRKPANPEG